MNKKEAEAAIGRLGITEKMAKLPEAAIPRVNDLIEQAIAVEQKQSVQADTPEHNN